MCGVNGAVVVHRVCGWRCVSVIVIRCSNHSHHADPHELMPLEELRATRHALMEHGPGFCCHAPQCSGRTHHGFGSGKACLALPCLALPCLALPHSTWPTSQVHIAQPSAHIGKSTNHIRFILSVSRAHRAPSTDRNSSVKAFRAGFSALTGWVYRVRSLYAR